MVRGADLAQQLCRILLAVASESFCKYVFVEGFNFGHVFELKLMLSLGHLKPFMPVSELGISPGYVIQMG